MGRRKMDPRASMRPRPDATENALDHHRQAAAANLLQ